MRSYQMIVNGKTYNVDVIPKKNGGAQVSRVERVEPAAPAAPAAKPAAPVSAPAPAAAPAAPTAAGEKAVTAPLPGSVLKVNCKVGDQVQANTVLFIVEAMKMENEIFAGQAGTVKAVNVTQGQTLETGTQMAVIG